MRRALLAFALAAPVAVWAGVPLLPGFCDGVIPPPPDENEPNDSMATATPVVLEADSLPLRQNFHTDDDVDWYTFRGFSFAVTGDVYSVRARSPESAGAPVGTFMTQTPPFQGPGLFFEFFASDGSPVNVLTPVEQGCFLEPDIDYELTLPAEDDYFVKVSQCRNEGLNVNGDMEDDKTQFCIPDNAGYQVQFFQPVGAQAGTLSGTVTDSQTGQPIASAILGASNAAFTTYSNPATGQFTSAITVTSNATANVMAPGYVTQTVQFDIAQSQTTPCDVSLTPEGAGSPDLQVNAPLVTPVNASVGNSITLSANARNLGDAAAGASTLRFFLSTDADISPTDTELNATGVNGLAAGAVSPSQAVVPTPSVPGIYFTGACVDAVTGESDTGNNCFGAAPLVVVDDELVFRNGFEGVAVKREVSGATAKGVPGACVPL